MRRLISTAKPARPAARPTVRMQSDLEVEVDAAAGPQTRPAVRTPLDHDGEAGGNGALTHPPSSSLASVKSELMNHPP